MAMQINKIVYFVFVLNYSIEYAFNSRNDGVDVFIGVASPLSVDVVASDVASRISIDHSVHVDHRDYLENVAL